MTTKGDEMRFFAALFVMVFSATFTSGAGEPRSLIEWRFDDASSARWAQHANQCKDIRIEEGILKGVTAGDDPFLTSPAFSIKATAHQTVSFKARYGSSGKGELFWVPEGASGPSQKWSVAFDWIGDGEWHEYHVRPFWQGEKRIGALRLDFVNGKPDVVFEIDEIRIIEGPAAEPHTGEASWSGVSLESWSFEGGDSKQVNGGLSVTSDGGDRVALTSPPLSINSDEKFIATFEVATADGESGVLYWASDRVSGLHRKSVRLKSDGKRRTYNIDLSGDKNWVGNIVLMRFAVPAIAKGKRIELGTFKITDELQGPADISIMQARLADALCRAGKPQPFLLQISNSGGRDASALRLRATRLPKGVRIASAQGWDCVATVPAQGTVTHVIELVASKALKGDVEFAVSGEGAEDVRARAAVEFLPDLALPKAAYVPEPKPVKTAYELGALYFPGWSKIDAWARIWPVAPERKPLLGWYDEANPEVVDWQIKWAVENGLSYFLVDWYWHKGYQHHDHWIKAFKAARYRSYLKWAVMWANHNAAGSHSEADQREVAKFWIENYFNMPEYYRIDDKPVVMIWSPQNMNRDLGGGDGCKQLLELSRQMARDAGYKGIYFIAMKWPEASWAPSVVQNLKDMGFDMTSIYHYMDHGGRATNSRRYSFDLVADSNYSHWKGLHQTGILPFLPNLSTGWDDRPWHGDKGIEIYGRTVEHFKRICRDAKTFADETGIRRMVLAPLNEWGEGSYAEPCAEFGFGMYEAVRDTFCDKPAGGWPLNLGPKDVGLGPYDLPIPPQDTSTEWSFESGTSGWGALMGISGLKSDGALVFTTQTQDPAIERKIATVNAKAFDKIVVRMRLNNSTPSDRCQLFWSAGGTPTEMTSLSLPLAPDGAFHDYVFEVGNSRSWRGRIGKLRFDACNKSGVDVAIERIQMLPVLRK